MPTKDDFREELRARLRRATARGAKEIVINAGELHRALGGYPGQGHQMPSCCDAMHEAQRGTDEELASPPSGRGASLTIRYGLPR